MSSTAKVTLEINASIEKVWDALTKPEIVKQYFFGTDLITDWQVGSDIVFAGEWQGQRYEDKGKVLEVTPQTKISYSYWSSVGGTEDKPENYNNISYELQSTEPGKTTLTVIQEGCKDDESRKHSEDNWTGVLKGMKEMLEAK